MAELEPSTSLAREVVSRALFPLAPSAEMIQDWQKATFGTLLPDAKERERFYRFLQYEMVGVGLHPCMIPQCVKTVRADRTLEELSDAVYFFLKRPKLLQERRMCAIYGDRTPPSSRQNEVG